MWLTKLEKGNIWIYRKCHHMWRMWKETWYNQDKWPSRLCSLSLFEYSIHNKKFPLILSPGESPGSTNEISFARDIFFSPLYPFMRMLAYYCRCIPRFSKKVYANVNANKFSLPTRLLYKHLKLWKKTKKHCWSYCNWDKSFLYYWNWCF